MKIIVASGTGGRHSQAPEVVFTGDAVADALLVAEFKGGRVVGMSETVPGKPKIKLYDGEADITTDTISGDPDTNGTYLSPVGFIITADAEDRPFGSSPTVGSQKMSVLAGRGSIVQVDEQVYVITGVGATITYGDYAVGTVLAVGGGAFAGKLVPLKRVGDPASGTPSGSPTEGAYRMVGVVTKAPTATDLLMQLETKV